MGLCFARAGRDLQTRSSSAEVLLHGSIGAGPPVARIAKGTITISGTAAAAPRAIWSGEWLFVSSTWESATETSPPTSISPSRVPN